MASSIIHLAIASELTKRHIFKDTDRLKLGSILPDASDDRNKSHLRVLMAEKNMTAYDPNRFRELFGELILSDDLYLGYYLHLVQDILYRHFVYDEYHWDPQIPGNVERLHRDYRISNYHVISKYQLEKRLLIPDDLHEEPLFRMANFNAENQIRFVLECFEPVDFDDVFFFTAEMADEFIGRAAAFCLKEIETLEQGGQGMDAYEFGWAVKQ